MTTPPPMPQDPYRSPEADLLPEAEVPLAISPTAGCAWPPC